MFKRYQLSNGKSSLVYDEDMHPWSMTKVEHYDTINPDSSAFNPSKLSVTYEIEYQDQYLSEAQNQGKWSLEPWEYYHKVKTDSLGEAFKMLMIRMLDDSPTEPKFFMQISNSNGNEVAETYMDIPHDLRPSLRQMVDENIRRKEHNYESEIEMLSREINLYKRFVEECHATETFKKWKEKQHDD